MSDSITIIDENKVIDVVLIAGRIVLPIVMVYMIHTVL